jgi:tetratricopeptide (TPR) repeat protein
MELSHPSAAAAPVPRPPPRTRTGLVYEPAIGPRLKILLVVVFVSVAGLGATGAYLVAIRLLNWWNAARGLTYTNQFTLGMFMAHVLLGVFLVVPFLVFGFTHLATARHRRNRVAVRLGILLFLVGIAVGLTGLALIQLDFLPQLPTDSAARSLVLWLHILTPVAAVALYLLHRRAGPDIKWNWGIGWGAGVALFVAAMCVLHTQDPRKWNVVGPKEGERYFLPSKMRTADGNFISAEALMMDSYCLKCHADIYQDWYHSAHHFSSFNNPPYLFSVRNTRKFSLERDGNVRASRWCAGCHDVVPFASGAFDNPDFDDVNDPTAKAGITCTVCHAITSINSPTGNGDYTIAEPQHYPFAYSQNPFLQWLNNQVVKAKPDFHKKMMLKPFHKTAEFCSTCHKVSLPIELNHYKEFLRGQNHYDTYLLSGVSGVGTRSFYYPPVAKTNCAECHMPPLASSDFGSKPLDDSGIRKVHNHGFPGANTGLPSLLSLDTALADHADAFRQAAQKQADFLRGTDPEGKDKKLRIDLAGIKEGETVGGSLTELLRPQVPRLKPGATYVVEVVIRTLNVGHPFPQGTVDSNEIWVDFLAQSGKRIVGRNGRLSGNESGTVDEWSHFVNVLMLDRNGNRIDRRNPEDIFTPLYDHQIPPGAGQVVHYRLDVPKDVTEPIKLTARLRYRKFDYRYMSLTFKDAQVPQLPIVDLCTDEVLLPIEGQPGDVPAQTAPIKPAWQRWNDYGIGCLLEGGAGLKKGELRQAEEAFEHLLKSEDKAAHAHGYLNLARVYIDEGRLDEAVAALNQAKSADPPAPWWTVAWFTGLVNAQNGHLDQAIASFVKILDPKNQPWDRRFDFTRDYVVINELATTLRKKAELEDSPAERDRVLEQAVRQYERTLAIDPEDLDAHYGLAECFDLLGKEAPVPRRRGEGRGARDEGPDEAALTALVQRFLDPQADWEQHLRTAGELPNVIVRFAGQPNRADKPKLAFLLGLIKQCRPEYDRATEAGLKKAAARVLGQLYRQTHAIYKPDDIARDRTIRLYKEKHPAAAAAAAPIVVYPTDRFGTP